MLLVSHGWASGTPAEHGPTIVEASPLVWLHAQGLVSDSWLGALPPLLGLGLVALVVLYDPRERRSDP